MQARAPAYRTIPSGSSGATTGPSDAPTNGPAPTVSQYEYAKGAGQSTLPQPFQGPAPSRAGLHCLVRRVTGSQEFARSRESFPDHPLLAMHARKPPDWQSARDATASLPGLQ